MKLKEIWESAINLSTRQKAVLAKIKAAQTPKMAYESILGSDKDVEAAKVLQRYHFIEVDEEDGLMRLTDKGENALIDYGIVDETGNFTEQGEKLVNRG